MPHLAIIPARGGSKRIPRKNIRPFLGKPIIAYSIEAALKSDLFDEVMVSTDDREIAEIAMAYGANLPFMRDPQSANDHAVLADVCEEVLGQYQKQGKTFDTACLIMATAPFVTAEKLVQAYQMLTESEDDCVLTVTEYSFPIQRSFQLEESRLKMRWPEHLNTRSQDLEKAYHDAGQFNFFKVKAFLRQKKLFMDRMRGLILDPMEVQDIDTLSDWNMAELKFRMRLSAGPESSGI